MPAKKIALFIDADNISARFGKQIIDMLESRGEIFIRRIYGNWEKTPLHGWNECIWKFSLRAVLHDSKAEIFALVTNDSDFTPLVIRLREGGMNIIGLGNANASNAFRAACNEFVDLDALTTVKTVKPAGTSSKVEKKISPPPEPVKKIPAAQKNSPVQLSLFDDNKVIALPSENSVPKKILSSKVVPITKREPFDARRKLQTLHDILHETAALHADKNGFVQLYFAGQCIREKNLRYGVKNFGYGHLRDFVADFPDLYELIHRDDENVFCYRCRVNEADDERLSQLHDILRVTAQLLGDDKGFAPLCRAGDNIRNKKLDFGLKDFGYGSLNKFVAAFPEMYEVIQRDNENVFYYRCRVNDSRQADDKQLSQLHDILREAVALHADDNGFANLCSVGAYVTKRRLGFGVKNFGYSSLKKFVADFPDLYELQRDDTKTFLRCRVNRTENSTLDSFEQLHEILREAAKSHADDDGFVNILYTVDFIAQKNLVGVLKDLCYNKLTKFVSNFNDRYEVRGESGNNFFYRCRVNDSRQTDDERLSQLHEILREAAKSHADDNGFSTLNCAGQELKRKHLGFGIKDFGYGHLREFVSDFPDLYETIPDGQQLRYRCRQSKK